MIAPHTFGGRYRRLEYAADGDLHLIYSSEGGVRHAWRSGETWRDELAAPIVGRSLQSVDMKLDPSGGAHLAFTTLRDMIPEIWYSKWSKSNGWTTPELVRSAQFEWYSTVALGVEAGDAPYLVYGVRSLVTSERTIFISRREKSDWSETAIYGTTVNDFPVLSTVTDGQHRPWIGFGSQFLVPTSAGYALQNSSSTRGAEFPQFVVDPDGTTIYASRLRGVTFGLGQFWTNEDLGAWIPTSRQPLVALSALGQPLAAFSNLSGNTLQTFLYRRESSGWVEAARYTLNDTVFDNNSTESDAVQERLLQPVALDPEARPVLVRLPDENQDLALIELRPDSALVSEIAIKPMVRTERGVVNDADGRLVVAHYEDRGLRIAREMDDGIFAPWGPRLAIGGWVESLVLDSEERPTLVVRDRDKLGVARLLDDEWEFEQLGTLSTSVSVNSATLALDGADTPRIVYSTSQVNNGIWSWSRGEAAPTPIAGDNALGPVRAFTDASGTLYAVYRQGVARWSGVAWQVATVTGAPYLDTDGNLCLVRMQSGGKLVSTCFEGGSPVTKQPYATFAHAPANAAMAADGTLYIASAGLSSGSELLVIGPDGSETYHTLPQKDVTITTAAGPPLMIHYDTFAHRLFARCIP